MKPQSLVALLLGLIAANACGSRSLQPQLSAVVPENDAFVYDLHEWGVIGQTDETLDVLGGNPQRVAVPDEMMVVEKPIVYLHHVAGGRSTPISLEVGLRDGRLMEVWPEPNAGFTAEEVVERERVARAAALPERVRFEVRFAESCPLASSLATLCSAAPAPDGYCERAQLGLYVSPDSDCLAVGSQMAPFVFYRGDVPNTLTSLTLERRDFRGHGGGRIHGHGVVALDFAIEDVTTAYQITYSQGNAVRFRIVSLRGGVDLLPLGFADVDEDDIDTVVERFESDLRLHGLTDGEVSAFMAAWRVELFQAQAAGGDGPVLLYWLPRSAIDRIAPLVVHPAPRNIRRAMLVRVALN